MLGLKNEGNLLKRSLNTRHINMIAVGGVLSSSLFLGGGTSISVAGPGGAVLSYIVIGLVIYFIMNSLGEMATYMPVSGSFQTYADRFVDPALGFALGWYYWLTWPTSMAAELTAGAILTQFWFPQIPGIVFAAALLTIVFVINFLAARIYGEAESLFAGLSLVAVLSFLVAGILILFGVLGGGSPGLENWRVGNAPFVGGLATMFNVFLIAVYSFDGWELVGITAGESKDPNKSIPRAIRNVFWRIAVCYIGTITIVSFLIPYTDTSLLNATNTDVAMSPFTIIFSRLGFDKAAAVMNAILLASSFSVCNSGLYASARMLYSMSKRGQAPKIFAKVNSRKVPFNALIATAGMTMLALSLTLFGEGVGYQWLLGISAMNDFALWATITWSHIRFRKALLVQGVGMEILRFKAKFFPYGILFAMGLCFVLIVGQYYAAFVADVMDWKDVAMSSLGIVFFFACLAFYRIKHNTRIIPLKEIDLSTDTLLAVANR